MSDPAIKPTPLLTHSSPTTAASGDQNSSIWSAATTEQTPTCTCCSLLNSLIDKILSCFLDKKDYLILDAQTNTLKKGHYYLYFNSNRSIAEFNTRVVASNTFESTNPRPTISTAIRDDDTQLSILCDNPAILKTICNNDDGLKTICRKPAILQKVLDHITARHKFLTLIENNTDYFKAICQEPAILQMVLNDPVAHERFVGVINGDIDYLTEIFAQEDIVNLIFAKPRILKVICKNPAILQKVLDNTDTKEQFVSVMKKLPGYLTHICVNPANCQTISQEPVIIQNLIENPNAQTIAQEIIEKLKVVWKNPANWEIISQKQEIINILLHYNRSTRAIALNIINDSTRTKEQSNNLDQDDRPNTGVPESSGGKRVRWADKVGGQLEQISNYDKHSPD